MNGIPRSSAAARYIAHTIEAGPLIVIDVVTASSGILSKRIRMSASELTATPSRPTSPRDNGSSASRPMSVGMSNAVESPVTPWASRYRKRAFVSSADPNPANWRIVQSRPRYMDG